METSAQYVPQVGDVVEVARSNGDPSIGKYYFVGDVGDVLHIDRDGDLYVSFNGHGNKNVVKAGEWYVGVENVRLVNRPVAATQPPVLSELLGERDAIRDELDRLKALLPPKLDDLIERLHRGEVAEKQRDRLLGALKSAKEALEIEGYYSPSPTIVEIDDAIAAVEHPSTRANTIEELRRVAEDRGYSPAWAERVMEARGNLPVVVAVESDSKFLGEPRTYVPSALQLIGRMHEPNADGWIKWDGTKKPIVRPEGVVEVMFSNSASQIRHAEYFEWRWGYGNPGFDIVAYRVLPKEAAK